MKKFLLLLLLCAGMISARAITDSIAPEPKDVSSVDGIIAALYDVISGPAGQVRNWDRMRTLFIPEARLIPTGKRPDGTAVRRVLSVEDYVKSSGPSLEKNGLLRFAGWATFARHRAWLKWATLQHA